MRTSLGEKLERTKVKLHTQTEKEISRLLKLERGKLKEEIREKVKYELYQKADKLITGKLIAMDEADKKSITNLELETLLRELQDKLFPMNNPFQGDPMFQE